MPTTSRPSSQLRRPVTACLDADVLARALTRTLLLLGSHQSSIRPVWSSYVASEADRHRKPNHAPLSQLRRYGWQAGPTGTDPDRFGATDQKDRQVLADAVAAEADFIVTANVRHFGEADLLGAKVAAVHFDLFLSEVLTRESYEWALRKMAASRRLPPNTPEDVHASIKMHHPLLYARHANVFPGEPLPPQDAPPAVAFRGGRCLRCGEHFDDPGRFVQGVGGECRDSS